MWIFRWNGNYFEKIDVAKATGNEYAALVKKDNGKFEVEAGKAGIKHLYSYKSGILIEKEY